MSSLCHTKPSCPTLPPTGYNVCIENDTELDQRYHFVIRRAPFDGSLRQSVTVPRNTSICYRVVAPLGDLVALFVADPLNDQLLRYAGSLTCSVHITTRTVVSLSEGELRTRIFTTLDCSPCPCPCELACVLCKSCTDPTPDTLAKSKIPSRCEEKGYKVCIENTRDENIRFNFFYANPAILIQPTVQSVMVSAGSTVCYRLNIPPGVVIGVRVDANVALLSPTHIACSTHLRAILSNNILFVASDCSPCPTKCCPEISSSTS